MDHSHINGSNGFGYDHSAWAQSMNVDQAEPEFFFGGDSSVPVGQQGYGAPAQSSTTYGQPQGHIPAYDQSYHQTQMGYDQYSHFPQGGSNIQHNVPLQHNLQGPGPAVSNGYSHAFDAGHSATPPAQAGYAVPRVASPYIQQPAIGHGMDGYHEPRLVNNGYHQQNAAGQHQTTGLQQSQQAQFFNNPHAQQQAVPVQQQQLPQQQQQRVSTPQQQAPNQLLYAQAQQQQQQQQVRPQAQHFQPQQQQLRAQIQQPLPPSQFYQQQPAAQKQPTSTLQRPFRQPLQAASQSPVPRQIPANAPATTGQFTAFSPQPSQSVLSVPDRKLRTIPTPIAPTGAKTEKWTGMHNAFISDNPEPFDKPPAAQKLLPVFARTDRRRLFSERPLLIPAEALGRYMDSLKDIGRNDPQAGVKHRTRRMVLEYDLRRVGAFADVDEETIESYDKVPKAGTSKFQAEAKKRNFDYPPLASEESISELDLLEMQSEAALDLPKTWAPSTVMIQQVAADFAELLVQTVNDLRAMPEYKELTDAVKASRTKAGLSAQEEARRKKIRATLDKGRERVRRVIAAALRVADDRVLANLSPIRMKSAFVIFINLTNTGDTNAPLTKALLDFAGRLPFLDESLVEGFKWSKLVAKLEAGDDDVKNAVAKIKALVKSNEGKPPSLPKPTSAPAANGEAPSKTSSAKVNTANSGNGAAKGSTSASSSKRPREEDGDGRVNKKPATEQRATSQPTTSQPSQKTTPTAAGPAKLPSASILSALKGRNSTSTVLPGKSRPATKILSGSKSEAVKSESKQPGNTQLKPTSTSKTEAAKPPINNSNKISSSNEAGKMSSKVKNENVKPEAPRTSSSSGFAALMSEIEKPKPMKRPAPTTPDKVEIPIDETDEERERRLRKEKRRRLNLRVSFKSEPELTAVRIFHKEEAEDEERDDHMVRDANDDKAEGRLLKASRSSQIDSDREWEEPTLIDFTTIPEEQRQNTFENRGGLIKVETEEQKIVAEKEMTELMVIYTEDADIPPTPASPRHEDEDFTPAGVEVASDPNLAARAALYMACGPRGGLDLLLRRKTSATTSTAAMLVNKVVAAQPYQNWDDPQVRQAKDEQVLKALTSATARNYVDPEPVHPQLSKIRRDYADPAVQAASKSIEALVASLAGQPAPPQEPPKWQQDPVRREEWITGYNNDKRAEEATRQAAQQSAMLAQQQANPYAQYYAQYQAQGAAPQQQQPAAADPLAATLAALSSATGGQPAQPGQPDPLQALMAAFANPAAAAQHGAAPPVDPNQALQLAMWAAASGAQQQQAPPPQAQAQSQQYGGNSASLNYDDDYSDEKPEQQQHRNNREQRSRGGRRGGKHGSRDGGDVGSGGDEEHLRGINRSLIGTKPCTFWARGNCNRGDKCTFRHG